MSLKTKSIEVASSKWLIPPLNLSFNSILKRPTDLKYKLINFIIKMKSFLFVIVCKYLVTNLCYDAILSLYVFNSKIAVYILYLNREYNNFRWIQLKRLTTYFKKS